MDWLWTPVLWWHVLLMWIGPVVLGMFLRTIIGVATAK